MDDQNQTAQIADEQTIEEKQKQEENLNKNLLEKKETPVEEAEIVEDKKPEFDEKTFLATKAMVNAKAQRMDELKDEIKEYNERLKNILINDSDLSEAEEQAKQYSQYVKKRKQELMESAESKDIKAKLRDLKEEMADITDSLSTQLLTLFQITGVKEFETDNGQVREFVITAKVKAAKN
ncbi:hypothetical protein GYA19_00765 [Candidatus Beckwithbacteria bacterium]|nr:hypothetical protein [Candidatus Beckwithbacteria bacterium]